MNISEKLYGALNNLLTHMEMQEQTEGFSLELNMFPFNLKATMDEAHEAIEAAQQAGIVGLAAGCRQNQGASEVCAEKLYKKGSAKPARG